MPVHDWTRVDAGIFHAFHAAWIAETQKRLNEGLLPDGYYALAEQHTGRGIADVLTLNAGAHETERPEPPPSGAIAVAEAPPRVSHRERLEPTLLARRRTIAIRHVSGHRLVAILEVVSPANKDRPRSLHDFVDKVVSALGGGIHVLLVDLLPPGPHDPSGTPQLIQSELGSGQPSDRPSGRPVTLASYCAAAVIEAYLEYVAFGDGLPEMPLFLHPERYINVPLEPTYTEAYTGMPSYWRGVLERAAR